VEETFQFTKNETGLDHYQVRKYHAWYRYIILSMLAAAFLRFSFPCLRRKLVARLRPGMPRWSPLGEHE
jgi:SRSO17 transposase